MTFTTLALICLAGILGPALATIRNSDLPVVLGELIAGIILGRTGVGILHSSDETFTFLAQIGFALVMFVAGSHVPVHDSRLRPALRSGVIRALVVAAVATVLGVAVARVFGTGHAAIYAVVMASSSAALVLPTVDSLGLAGDKVLDLLPQVALADTACIVALPLAIDPHHAARAALGGIEVIGAASVAFVVLREAERRGARRRLHALSERRRFALELRINLLLLFGLAALATRAHVSVLLAGFSFGIVVAAIGEPRRLARQLFAITDGFFGPLFFVWLGSSLDLRALAEHPSELGLGIVLGAGAVGAHLVTRLMGAPLSLSLLAAAQLGVPVAAATLGSQLHILQTGEPAALILGAVVTIAVVTIAGRLAVNAGLAGPASGVMTRS